MRKVHRMFAKKKNTKKNGNFSYVMKFSFYFLVLIFLCYLCQFYPEGTIVSSGISKWASAGGWRVSCKLLLPFCFSPSVRLPQLSFSFLCLLIMDCCTSLRILFYLGKTQFKKRVLHRYRGRSEQTLTSPG